MNDTNTIIDFKIARALIVEIDILTNVKITTAWRKIVARMLFNIKGVENSVIVTTTPKDFKFVYHQFNKNPFKYF